MSDRDDRRATGQPSHPRPWDETPPAEDPALDLVLTEALYECRTLIAAWRNQPTPARTKLNRRGRPEPVTDVDLAVKAVLATSLRAAWPDVPIVDEEDPDLLDTVPEDCLLVDPIDGTAPLLAGAPDFSIAICLVRRGRPVQAVVDLPAYGVCLSATTTRLHVHGNVDRLPRFAPDTVLISPRQQTNLQQVTAEHGALNVAPVPTTTVKMVLVATGNASAAIYWPEAGWGAEPWDYAAAALTVAAAGGSAYDNTGRNLARTRPAFVTGWRATAPNAPTLDLAFLTSPET